MCENKNNRCSLIAGSNKKNIGWFSLEKYY